MFLQAISSNFFYNHAVIPSSTYIRVRLSPCVRLERLVTPFVSFL